MLYTTSIPSQSLYIVVPIYLQRGFATFLSALGLNTVRLFCVANAFMKGFLSGWVIFLASARKLGVDSFIGEDPRPFSFIGVAYIVVVN